MHPAELFTTERLRVRQLTASDLDIMLELYGDADSMRWVGDSQPLDRAACQLWLEKTAANYRNRGYGLSVVELLAGNAVLGFCGLVHPHGQDQAEIKYAMRRSCRGKGYASEAVAGMLEYGHREFALNPIVATVAPENLASLRILEKCGMCYRHSVTDELGFAVAVYEWRPHNQVP